MAKLRVGDIELYYETIGIGEPVLLIHGLGSGARDWELQIDYFAEDYQVVIYDIRGHGRSDKPPGPYSIPLFARDTVELIKALDIASTHVVGISMGGMIGLQLAVDAPDLVRSLVAVNCVPDMVIKTLKDRFQVWQRSLITQIFGMRKMGEVLGGWLFPKTEQEEIRQIFIERWAENDPRAYREAFNAVIGWTVNDHLEAITCPVLVISADKDYTPVEAKEAFVCRLKQGEMVVIEDSYHATPVDQTEEFNQVVGDFLKRVG
jgi:pimeloyl-ACP methyl ester carboxylesterase